MEVNILKSSKEEIEVEIENLAIVELLRVYLNKDSDVTFAAWKREHPTEKPIFLVKTKGKTAKKAIKPLKQLFFIWQILARSTG